MKKILTLLVIAIAAFTTGSAQLLDGSYTKATKTFTGQLPTKETSAAMSSTKYNMPIAAQPKKARFGGEDGFVDGYAFIPFDVRYNSLVWAKLNTGNFAGYTRIRDYGTVQQESNVYQTATFVGDRVFAQQCVFYFAGVFGSKAFGWLDPETTEFTPCFTWTTFDNLFRDMTYDPVSDKIYLVDTDNEFQNADIYVIDPNNPTTLTKACTVNAGIITLSADNGYLYGVVPNTLGSSNTRLVKINTSSINTATQTCTLEEIRPSGMNIAIAYDMGGGVPQVYWQSMEFDKTNHRLWWVTSDASGNSLAIEINHKTGAIISRNQFTTDPLMIALSLPYQTAEANAPSYVRNLTAQAGAEGAPTANFTWSNPTQTYMKENLTQLNGVKVYRNDVLVKTVNTTQVGAEITFEDTNVPTGYHNYKFVTFNAAGDGLYKDVDLFVGRDTPEGVIDPTLTSDGGNAVVTWTAPQKGQHDGWIDASTLKYKVVRFPDNKVIAEATTDTEIVDNTITTWGGYYYEITPSTVDGEGSKAQTNVLAMGPGMTIPYTNNFSTQAKFNEWTVLDANDFGGGIYGDGVSWAFDSFRNLASYASYTTLNKGEDYLVSPKFNFEAGKEYQIRYKYYTINWVDENRDPIMEEMQVYYGQQPTATGLSTLVKDLGEFHTASATYLYGKDNFKPEAGEGYIAFKATSPGDRGIIFLNDFSLREYSDKDLSVTKFNASSTANATIRQEAGIDVTNEGKAAQSNYTVEVFNVGTGEVLGQSAGEAVNPGETVNVKVSWTPKEAGNITISARVVLDGDTYPEDNVWKDGIEVLVNEADGSRWFAANADERTWDEGFNDYLNRGWNGPIHLNWDNSIVQQLFLSSEMRSNVYLTGVQFVYDADANGDIDGFSTNVAISLKKTDRTTLQSDPNDFSGAYTKDGVEETGGWTKVYDGPITFDGAGDNNLVTIMFDNEFKYDNGNILVQYDYSGYAIDFCPYWHFYEYKFQTETYRTTYKRWDNGQSPSGVQAYAYATHTRFGYKDDPEVSVKSAKVANVNIYQVGDNVMLTNTCDYVEMFNTAGARVMAAKNVNTVSTRNLAKGVYTVKVQVDGQIQTKKLVVK
ncbi:MAG: T9SS type A sorting domain-containing protein [Prevotella sp.]|nr:T9SS type A sorting domain-containing protein [Prevotella sp.]MBQ9178308.1 T9SS type A sorting domain-containing protein [Prevotella sp.]